MTLAADADRARIPRNVTLLLGDCLQRLDDVESESVDLAYLDPPFNTGVSRIGQAGRYADRWADPEAYMGFLAPRIAAVIARLRPHGAIMIHCDWRTVHHIRLLLDDLLGPDRFVNHLVWRYGLGGSSPRRFARKHDDILYYARGPEYYFNPPQVPATSRRMQGMMKKATDVLDIPAINNQAKERTGYPTQKPIALLELLLSAACPPGGMVLDPFCGSGTTLVAAAGLGRSAIGIDVNGDAITIAQSRLSTVS